MCIRIGEHECVRFYGILGYKCVDVQVCVHTRVCVYIPMYFSAAPLHGFVTNKSPTPGCMHACEPPPGP